MCWFCTHTLTTAYTCARKVVYMSVRHHQLHTQCGWLVKQSLSCLYIHSLTVLCMRRYTLHCRRHHSLVPDSQMHCSLGYRRVGFGCVDIIYMLVMCRLVQECIGWVWPLGNPIHPRTSLESTNKLMGLHTGIYALCYFKLFQLVGKR